MILYIGILVTFLHLAEGLRTPLPEYFHMHTDLIFGVGAHRGIDTAYYLSCGFRVVAVEAHPLYGCLLYQRFRKEVSEGRVHILNIAVAEQPGLCALLESQAESQWDYDCA
jgi:hypothetical protein